VTGGRDHRLPDTTSRAGLVAGLVLGLPLVAVGLRGALVNADRTHPAELAAWVVGSAVVHDVVVVPAVVAVGWLGRRVVPAPAWPAVRAGLAAAGVLAVVAWPFVRGYGRDPANPSLLPRDYGAGLAAGLAAIALATAAASLVAVLRARRRPRRARGEGPAPTPPSGR
jgi:hypothetical protein